LIAVAATCVLAANEKNDLAAAVKTDRAAAAGKAGDDSRRDGPITFPDNAQEKADADVVPNDVPTLEKTAGRYDTERAAAFTGPSIWRVIFSLAIVILLIVGVVWLLKQVWARGMRFDMKGRHIRVLDVVSLGMNRSIYLVAVGGKLLLLGSSDKGLNYLMEVNGLEAAGELPEGMPREGGVSFQGALENAAIQDIVKSQSRDTRERTVSFMDRLKSKLRKLDEEK
jgi:flagellar biosynthetic protein FliO